MATLTQTRNILTEITHLTEKQIRAVSTKLQQVDLIPVSSGRDVKHLTERQFALLFLACYVDAPGLKIADAAQSYFNLADKAGRLAGDALADALTSDYEGGASDAPTIMIEMSDPAVCVVGTSGERWFGAHPDHEKIRFRVELAPEAITKAASMWRKAEPPAT